MAARSEEMTLEEFSRAFLAYQRMPRSWKLKVLDGRTDRIKRKDTLVKVHPLRAPRIVRVTDDLHVSDLHAAAAAALTTDVDARRWKFKLYKPSPDGVGEELVPAHTTLSRLVKGEDARQAQVQMDAETDSLLVSAEEHVLELHDLADDPDVTVPRAYIRALIARYGAKAVRLAMNDR